MYSEQNNSFNFLELFCSEFIANKTAIFSAIIFFTRAGTAECGIFLWNMPGRKIPYIFFSGRKNFPAFFSRSAAEYSHAFSGIYMYARPAMLCFPISAGPGRTREYSSKNQNFYKVAVYIC